LQSGEDYSIFELFSNGKTAWTRSTARGPRWRRSTVDLGQGVGDDLTGAQPSGRSRTRRLIIDGTTVGGARGARLGLHRGTGDGGEETAKEVLGASNAWAFREGKRSGESGGHLENLERKFLDFKEF
jgi:hypothetical protein